MKGKNKSLFFCSELKEPPPGEYSLIRLALWLLGLAAVVEYAAILAYTGQARLIWFPFTVFALVLWAFSRARSAAEEWGELVKSAFDLFLPELYRKLEFDPSAKREERQALWRRFSQAVLYRLPKTLPAKAVGQEQHSQEKPLVLLKINPKKRRDQNRT